MEPGFFLDCLVVVLVNHEGLFGGENASFDVSQIALLLLFVVNAVGMDRVVFNAAPVVKHLAGNDIYVEELEVIVGVYTVDVELFIQLVPVQAV